jgi:hypothetical protein
MPFCDLGFGPGLVGCTDLPETVVERAHPAPTSADPITCFVTHSEKWLGGRVRRRSMNATLVAPPASRLISANPRCKTQRQR